MAKFTGVRPKNGGIEIRWQHQGYQYSRFINQAPTQTNLEDATRQRKKFIELCKLGDYQEESGLSPTFIEVAEDMLKYKAKNLKQSTLDAMQSKLNKHWESLFHLILEEITLKDLRNAERKITGIAPKTKKNSISDLKQVFKYAMDEDIIDIDPSVKLKSPKFQKKPIDSFSPEEKESLIKAFDDKFKLFYLFMLDSGMRTGEVQGLKWTDIKQDYAHVERSIYRGDVTTTKTHQARRVLLSPRTVKALKARQSERFKSEWIFSPRGSDLPYATDRSPTLKFKAACEAAEVRYRRPYYCRHTYVTLALRSGVNAITVAKQIGDRLETMQKNYADIMTETNDREELEKAHG